MTEKDVLFFVETFSINKTMAMLKRNFTYSFYGENCDSGKKNYCGKNKLNLIFLSGDTFYKQCFSISKEKYHFVSIL